MYRELFVVGKVRFVFRYGLHDFTMSVFMTTLFRDYPFKPVSFTRVRLNDRFWLPRLEMNRTVTIPFAFEQCVKNGRVYNFERAASVLRGKKIEDLKPPGFPFDDTDVYKIIEGASYCLAAKYDPELDNYLDRLIDTIAAAQEPDGYLYTTRTLNPQSPHPWAGPQRWIYERDLSHELYNLGHLYEAADAHHQATGKTNLLQIALKSVELMLQTFGKDKQPIWPGHPIIEMGLIRLYRITKDNRYLELTRFLIDSRGPDGHKGSGSVYNQSHQHVIEQSTAVGHAVRAAYLYCGIADIAAITGQSAYLQAIDRIWQNTVSCKLYITGGIGSTKHGEAFEDDYVLPNLTAYCETCAAIANVYWNHRMFLLHGDTRYIDVLERSLYNNVLSGISLDGKAFFYPNPLESDGTHERQTWFGCSCCPSNLCRFLASVPGYFYATSDHSVYINLYASSTVTIDGLTLTQKSNYPWDGTIRIDIHADRPVQKTLHLRVPGWAQNQPVPSDLYRFADSVPASVELRINGRPEKLTMDRGYVLIDKRWDSQDQVELRLPMSPRKVVSHPNVRANRNRIAITRGPLVYCFEAIDNPHVSIRSTVIDSQSSAHARERPDLLGGIVTLEVPCSSPKPLTGIPYYAWANRGKNEMVVWMESSQNANSGHDTG